MKKWYQYWTVWAAIIAGVAGDVLASANRNSIHINAVGYTAGVLMLAAAVFAVVFVVQYSRDKKAAREAAEAAHAAELRAAWEAKKAAQAAEEAAATEALRAARAKYEMARANAEARDKKRKAEYLQLLAELPAADVCISDSPAPFVGADALDSITYSNITTRTPRDKLSNYVVIDTETTGLTPGKNKIIDVAAIRFRDWMPVEKFSTLLSPGSHIPVSATKINGITDDMVADKPQFRQVAQSLIDFIGDDNVVGHNIEGFDVPFVVLAGANLAARKRKYYDTLTIARRTLKRETRDGNGDVENYKLHTLCEYYNIPHYETHRAENDALSTGYLLKALADDRQ